MSHQSETIICPNCGNHATGNYCNQCGQETHLHKDTLWALTVHFVGHYFHYDSKFWQTLKTLISSPGKLTLAYWNKQRNRYLSPISLYLFVSFVFFFFFISVTSSKSERAQTGQAAIEQAITQDEDRESDSIANATIERYTGHTNAVQAASRKHQYFANKDAQKEFGEQLIHNSPKLFFFMIPLMAIILKVLFLRRKELTIVHHTIFSIHIQSFYFLCLLPTLNQFENTIVTVIDFILVASPIVYTSIALRKVYGTGWLKAIIYNLVIIISYGIFIILVMAAYLAIVLAREHYFPTAH